MDLEHFGRALRLRRQELDKSLADVGRDAGCTRQNVHKVEHARSNPTLQTLDRISTALGLRLELAVVDADTPSWPSDDPRLLERAKLESRMLRLSRSTPDGRLDALAIELARLEREYTAPPEELAASRTLASLLEEAGIDRDVAAAVAAETPDKPDDWERHPDRFATIFDEARRRMAS